MTFHASVRQIIQIDEIRATGVPFLLGAVSFAAIGWMGLQNAKTKFRQAEAQVASCIRCAWEAQMLGNLRSSFARATCPTAWATSRGTLQGSGVHA